MSTVDQTTTGGNGWVGQAIRRKEDPPLIAGRGTYVDNMSLPGMLWAAIVRSPVAHAAITSIDTSAAAARPGIVAVLTADDLKDDIATG
ncbi:MAG: aerobic carbon-monoxide dehydrogenase large subunit, partial [Thermoleophilaceae bacterium]|nr:aerobic carbon-monoxide dehydrogenase large subunit [Thermoleophilaceae bacterium]